MPTPVSALLHAATLVTAGIYLLIRISPILEFSGSVLLIITLIGSSTAFFAATCGLLQNDLKRIIAFSTISQLGYMMMAIGLSQYNVALMHTVNHAFFKALLFLGAGINVLAINPAIFWKLLYKSITKVLQTGQSKGNLIYKILEILRGHTQELIIIILFFLDFNICSSFDLYSSVLLFSQLNFSSQAAFSFGAGQKEKNMTNKNLPLYLLPLFLQTQPFHHYSESGRGGLQDLKVEGEA